MEAAFVEQQLTSGASDRIIPLFNNLHRFLVSVVVFLSSILLRRASLSHPVSSPPVKRGRFFLRKYEEDTMRRRAMAESLVTRNGGADDTSSVRSNTFLFSGARRNSLFCRSWFPIMGEVRAIIIIIHGLNEHSGRYAQFAEQLTNCSFGVCAMDWTGHGGSDGLHGYVPSLYDVVDDTGAFLEMIRQENPGIPCFLFGHSTGGSVVLKAASYAGIERMVGGIIVTSPALRVRPSHPIVGAMAPLFSLVVPTFQFKGANKKGIPVCRDPAAMAAKYSDPLVYTGPMRVRTGHEILRISSDLRRNLSSVTVPFFVLHGTADTVTDPLASQDLYTRASSTAKHMKLYDGFLHDLLFEPEREQVGRDIIAWIEMRLQSL